MEPKIQDGIERLPTSFEATVGDQRTRGRVKKMARAMEKMGLIGISAGRLKAMRELGLEINAGAMLRDAQAGAMVAQQAVLDTLVDLRRMYSEASDKGRVKLVPHIGYLVRTLTAANHSLIETVGELPQQVRQSKPTVMHTMVPLQVVNEITVEGGMGGAARDVEAAAS